MSPSELELRLALTEEGGASVTWYEAIEAIGEDTGPRPRRWTERYEVADTLGLEAEGALHLLAALEDDQRGDAANLVAHRDLRSVVGVHLRHEHLSDLLVRDLVDERRDHLARRTPVRIEIHQHRDLRIQDRPLEVLLGDLHRAIEQHRLAALATHRAIRGPLDVDGIERQAEAAALSSAEVPAPR